MNDRCDADDDGAALCDALAAQERRVLGLLLPDRWAAEPIARAAGLDARHFGQPDHRLIFAGWQVACEHGLRRVPMLGLIELGLKAEGLWDDAVTAGSTGMMHSHATLARLGVGPLGTDEIKEIVRHPDGLRRAVARHVVALVEAADALNGAAA